MVRPSNGELNELIPLTKRLVRDVDGAVDIVEDGHYVVRAEIAGIDPTKDLDLSVGAGYLSIRAERSSHVEGKHRSEFRYGTFSRSLQLPESANPDDVTAEYTNGILTVKVGMRDEKADTLRKVAIATGES